MTAAGAATADPPEVIDPGAMHDPRSVGIALKLRQMIDDLARADDLTRAEEPAPVASSSDEPARATSS